MVDIYADSGECPGKWEAERQKVKKLPMAQEEACPEFATTQKWRTSGRAMSENYPWQVIGYSLELARFIRVGLPRGALSETSCARPEIRRESMLRNIIGLAISAFFIVLIFHMLDFRATLNHLVGIRPIYIAPFVLCHLAGLFFRSFRWRLILTPAKRIRLGTLFSVTVIGYMLSNILPLKLGELARIFLLEQREKISKMTTAATLLLEKLVDAVLVTLVFLPIALSSPLPSWLKPVLVGASAIIAAVSLLLLYASRADRQSFRLLRGILAGRAPRLHHFIERTYDRFLEGLGVLRGPGLLLKVLLASLPIFLFGGLSAYWLIKALGLGLVPFQAAFVTFIFIYFSALIPSAPGGVGTLEYFAILALSLFAVPKDLGLSFALSYHSLVILDLIILGLFFLIRENISLFQLRELLTRRPGLRP